MFTRLRILTFAILTMMTAVAAWCYPTIYGETGLVQVPSADVVPYTFLNVAVNYARPDNTQPSSQGRFNTVPLRLTYGIGTGAEIIFFDAFASGSGVSRFNVIGGGLKFQAYKEDPYELLPGWAFGVRGYSMELANPLNIIEGYTVVSKVLYYTGDFIEKGFAIRAHAGAAYTSYSGGSLSTNSNCASVFTGVSFKQAIGLGLDVDFLPKQESNGTLLQSATLSGVVRYPFNDDSSIELGLTRAFGSDQTSIYAGFSVLYGNRAEVTHRQPVLE